MIYIISSHPILEVFGICLCLLHGAFQWYWVFISTTKDRVQIPPPTLRSFATKHYFFFPVINLYSLVGRRCVICQMEYKRGDRRITLPCKHLYHAGCGTRWLSINKVSCSGFFTIWICWCFESVGLSLADSIWSFRLAQYVTLRCLLMRQSARNNPDELKKDESLQSRWFFIQRCLLHFSTLFVVALC